MGRRRNRELIDISEPSQVDKPSVVPSSALVPEPGTEVKQPDPEVAPPRIPKVKAKGKRTRKKVSE